MTTQERTDIAIYMYAEGYLCTCCGYDRIWDDEKVRYMLELKHTPECSGRIKVMELLRDEAERHG